MAITITREELLSALQSVIGVVERRNTLPILSHVLFEINDDVLAITASDLEVELVGYATLAAPQPIISFTVPGRKLLDICKALPDRSDINISYEKQQVIIKSGRSRFTLMTLPAEDFPKLSEQPAVIECQIYQEKLRSLLDKTHVAMAQQDVRYYLNGMLFDLSSDQLTVVATDGHRLAVASDKLEDAIDVAMQVIVPRKGIQELLRLLSLSEEKISLYISQQWLKVVSNQYVLTTKLIDGKFPDYHKVVPKAGKNTFIADKGQLKQILSRTSILSNEKHRAIRFELSKDMLQVAASNPEQEEAVEEISLDYQGEAFSLGFNVTYLIDALSVFPGNIIKFYITDAKTGVLIEEEGRQDCIYVVMPMRI